MSSLRLAWSPGTYAAATRAAVSMGVPLAVGAAVGHLPWGLTATMGAFTSIYARAEPYRRRALMLAAAGAGFVLCLTAGSLAAGRPLLAIIVIGLVGAGATYVCDALRMGPPGGYLFALVCATATSFPADLAAIPQRAALALSGAAVAWLVGMSGMLVSRHGPETAAVAQGYSRVAAYLSAVGGPSQDAAQHDAALALRNAWYASVSAASQRGRRTGSATHLQLHAEQAHQLFSAAIRAAAESREPISRDVIGGVERIAQLLRDQGPAIRPLAALSLPQDEPAARRALRVQVNEALRTTAQGLPIDVEGELLEPSTAARLLACGRARHSLVLPAALRVGMGAVIAGWLAHAWGLPESYWAAAAAIVVLQGANVTSIVRRSLHRSAGTAAGVVAAGGILALHPDAPALVAVVMVLQFAAEATIGRNYALGVAFITPLSLLLAEAANPSLSPAHLVGVRLLDTALGCIVAVLVSLTLWRRVSIVRLPHVLGRAIRTGGRAWELILADSGKANGAAARSARHRLRTELINLRTVADSAIGEPSARGELERLWPVVAASQRLGYLTVSASPSLRRKAHLGPVELERLDATFRELASSAEAGSKPSSLRLPDLSALPSLHEELVALYDSLGTVDR